MGIIRTIGNLFRGSSAPAAAPAPSEARRSTGSSMRPSAPPPVDPASREAEAEWAKIKDFICGCDAHGLDLGRLQREDPVGFWTRHAQIEAEVARGLPLDRAALNHGFKSGAHWKLVERYFEARYSTLAVRGDGRHEIRFVSHFQMARDLVAQQRAEAAREAAVEQRQLEPIQGITVERFGEIAAIVSELGSSPSRAELSEVLEGLGIGAAGFGRVRRGWQERMDADATGGLKKLYQTAFRRMRQDRIGSGVYRRESVEEANTGRAPARQTWVERDELAS